MHFMLTLHINIWSSNGIKYSPSPQSNQCLRDPNGPGSWAETKTDTSSANRKRGKERDHIRVEKLHKDGAENVSVSSWVVLSDRGILSREDSGVLAQVQVQEGVGVLITGAQSLRERHYSWERERQREKEVQMEKRERDRRRMGDICSILKDGEGSQNILCPYIIHTHLQQQVWANVMESGA